MNNETVNYIVNYKKIIVYVMCYFMFTILLLDFGPINYNLENGVVLHIYIFSYFLSFYFGYKLFSKKNKFSGLEIKEIREFNLQKIKKILKIGIYINFILISIFCLISTDSSSVMGFLNKFLSGITDPASSYYDKVYASSIREGSSILNVIFMFLYPYMLLLLVLSVYDFKNETKLQKAITIITIILEVARWIAIGTNKGVFDILILFITIYLMKSIEEKEIERQKIIKNKMKFKYKLLITVAGIIIFSMFTYFISSRMYIDNSNRSVKERIYYGMEKITNYLVQGYKGMDYALNLEWKPTFGVGNSIFLTSQVDKALNTKLSELTYAKRAEIYGWSSTVNWHTAYTWFANDMHFLGVIVLMFFCGAFLAMLIKETIIYRNYYSMVLLYMIMIGIFYSSANNQVLAFSNMCIAFYVFFILRWIKVRKEKKYSGERVYKENKK